MMNERGRDNDDIEQSSSLLTEKPKETHDIPFCGCLSVRYYQPYFDVDTEDVTTRLKSSLLCCRSENTFLATINDRPDAYGPFWVRYLFDKVASLSCLLHCNTQPYFPHRSPQLSFLFWLLHHI